jgi:3-oxoacyl-[acyl-carrier protein] reductase
MLFSGKVAIITGSARGIGASIALELGACGASVVINFTNESSRPKAEVVRKKIIASGGDAVLVQADIGSPDACKALVDAALTFNKGGIHILINNAAVDRRKLLKDVEVDDINVLMNVNFRGPLLIIQAVINHMPPGGRIINVSSILARVGVPTELIYSATKGALEAMTRTLAAELTREYGITVNAINPGPVDTDLFNDSSPEWLDSLQPYIDNTPVGARKADPSLDITPIVKFLCSEDARWVTGSVMSANGGMLMR